MEAGQRRTGGGRRRPEEETEFLARIEAFWLKVVDPDYYVGLRRVTPQSTLGGETANRPTSLQAARSGSGSD
jgi:hypothetical protein